MWFNETAIYHHSLLRKVSTPTLCGLSELCVRQSFSGPRHSASCAWPCVRPRSTPQRNIVPHVLPRPEPASRHGVQQKGCCGVSPQSGGYKVQEKQEKYRRSCKLAVSKISATPRLCATFLSWACTDYGTDWTDVTDGTMDLGPRSEAEKRP